jgi:hypothetical protein
MKGFVRLDFVKTRTKGRDPEHGSAKARRSNSAAATIAAAVPVQIFLATTAAMALSRPLASKVSGIGVPSEA